VIPLLSRAISEHFRDEAHDEVQVDVTLLLLLLYYTSTHEGKQDNGTL